MKKLILPIVVSLLSLTSNLSHSAMVWTNPAQITGIYADTRDYSAAKGILVRHGLASNTECTLNNTVYYYLDTSTQAGQAAYSLVLSAQAQNKNVVIMTDGCTSNGYPIIRIIKDH